MIDIPSETIFNISFLWKSSRCWNVDNINLQLNFFLIEIIGDKHQKYENVNWDVSLYALNGCHSSKEYSGIFIASVLYFPVQEYPFLLP